MTGLETALIGLGSVCLGSFGTWFTISRFYVSRRECNLRHKDEQKTEKNFQLIFEMLREVILCLPIDNEKKAEILNKRRVP